MGRKRHVRNYPPRVYASAPDADHLNNVKVGFNIMKRSCERRAAREEKREEEEAAGCGL